MSLLKSTPVGGSWSRFDPFWNLWHYAAMGDSEGEKLLQKSYPPEGTIAVGLAPLCRNKASLGQNDFLHSSWVSHVVFVTAFLVRELRCFT